MRRPFLRLPLLYFLLLAAPAFGAVFPTPTPVSPGLGDATAKIASRCPTFSWSEVPGAWGYEIVVFTAAEAGAADPDTAEPLLRVDVPPYASSWTPAVEQCLADGGRYEWFVREVAGPGRSAGLWSPAASFAVDAAAVKVWTDEEIARLIDRWMKVTSERTPRAGTDDILDDIWSALDNIRDSASAAASRAQTVVNWTNGVGPLTEVKDSAATLVSMFADGRNLINGTSSAAGGTAGLDPHMAALFEDAVVRQLFQDTAGMLRSFAHEQAAGLAAFVATPGGGRCGAGSQCALFRAALVAAFTDIESLMNAAAALGGRTGPHMSLSVVTTLLNQMPPAVLYLLYRADQALALTARTADIRAARDALVVISPLFGPPGAAALGGRTLGGTGPCARISGSENAYRLAANIIQGAAVVLKIAGKIFESVGEIGFHAEVGVAVADGALKASPAASFGKVLNGGSELLLGIGGALSGILTNCNILDRFTDIDTTLTSIINSLDSAAVIVETSGIERQLASCDTLVSLYLPETHGGNAETVAGLVRTWINGAAAAGIRTNDAEQHYARSVSERNGGQYIRAFRSLCSAYQALTNGN